MERKDWKTTAILRAVKYAQNIASQKYIVSGEGFSKADQRLKYERLRWSCQIYWCDGQETQNKLCRTSKGLGPADSRKY